MKLPQRGIRAVCGTAGPHSLHSNVGSEAKSAAEHVLAISPHLDDAVFACGEILATAEGATVVTVFAGRPGARATMTSWDSDSGFATGDDVMGARRDEDRRALACLSATPVWLDFRDDQYGDSPSIEAIADALSPLVARDRVRDILVPLGLFHADHRRTHEAALSLTEKFPDRRWIVYEEAIYRRIDGLRDAAIESLRRAGHSPRRIEFSIDRLAHECKRAAVACYGSQLRALSTPGRPGHVDALSPERYWRIDARSSRS
jgi:LmbE family N-acetylglucosaminyl deacetylase